MQGRNEIILLDNKYIKLKTLVLMLVFGSNVITKIYNL